MVAIHARAILRSPGLMPVATRSSSPALRIGLGAAAAALVWVSWAGAGMRLSTLSNPLNVRGLLTVAEGVWPPDVSGLFLGRVVNAVVQTLAMAIAGGALGCAAGLALGALGRMGRVGVVARGLSRVLAAVPDVVWALLLVVGFGPGPLAGALGLAVGATG